MKWIRLLMCLSLFSAPVGCTIKQYRNGTIVIRPYPPPKKKVTKKTRRKHNGSVAEKPSTKPRQIIVDAKWIETYERLQREHGGYEIPEDSEIQALGDKFVIPKAVQDHFLDMSKARSTPPQP